MKKRMIVTICFVLAAAVFIAGGFYLLRQKEQAQARAAQQQAENQSAYQLADDAYREAAQTLESKLYASDIDGLFYALSPVRYFYAQGDALQELKPDKTIQPKVVAAGVEMAFEIPLVTIDKQVFGVGLWAADGGAYNNAFAIVRNMPSGISDAPYVLMADVSNKDAGATERNYSELLAVEKNGSVRGYLFDQRNRTVESTGKLRTDWDVMNTALLQLSYQTGSVYSLSGRKYNREHRQLYDLRVSKGGSMQTVAEGIADTYAAVQNGGYAYICYTKAGWALMRSAAGKQSETAAFAGDLQTDYVLCGKAVLKKEDNTLIDFASAKTVAPPCAFKVLYDVAQADGKTVYIGKEENRDGEDFKVQLIVAVSEGETKALYANDIMDENTPVLLCRAGIITQKQGKSVFISYAALESIAGNVLQ